MNKKHTFTAIAPELNPDGLSEKYLETWKWCIRCGVLKLGRSYYVQGPNQTKTVKSQTETPPCV